MTMKLLNSLSLVVIVAALSTQAFMPYKHVVSRPATFVAATKSDLIGAAAVASVMLTSPQNVVAAAPVSVVYEAPVHIARSNNDAVPSLISSSNMMLSGLLDDYDGVFEDETGDSSSDDAPDEVQKATEKEYADQVKAREQAEKEKEARQKEAEKAAKAAEKEKRVAERALRAEREKENQRLAVESAKRAAELKKQE